MEITDRLSRSRSGANRSQPGRHRGGRYSDSQRRWLRSGDRDGRELRKEVSCDLLKFHQGQGPPPAVQMASTPSAQADPNALTAQGTRHADREGTGLQLPLALPRPQPHHLCPSHVNPTSCSDLTWETSWVLDPSTPNCSIMKASCLCRRLLHPTVPGPPRQTPSPRSPTRKPTPADLAP